MRYTPLLFQGGPWPVRELVLQACRLDPEEQRRDDCTLGLIDWVIDASGQPQRLAPVGGRVGGGYGRVSLKMQRYLYSRANQNRILVGGEFSELDQFEQIINHFVSRKQAFILYNDSGCSGAWPVDDQQLIERTLKKKARRYEQVFRSIMIESRRHRLDSNAIRAMEDYLTETIDRILSGSRVGEAVSEEEDQVEVKHTVYKHKSGRKMNFRPALTCLWHDIADIHTVVAVEMSRLGRNHALMSVLARDFGDANVKVEWLYDKQEWIEVNRDEQDGDDEDMMVLMDGITTFLMAQQAESALTAALSNCLKGWIKALEEGRPHGQLPQWLERTKTRSRHKPAEEVSEDEVGVASEEVEEHYADDGDTSELKPVRINEDMALPILKGIDLFCEQKLGPFAVCTRLTRLAQEDARYAPAAAKGWRKRLKSSTPVPRAEWDENSFRHILQNPALVGIHRKFGREWHILPPLLVKMDDHGRPLKDENGRGIPDFDKFDAIQVMLGNRKNQDTPPQVGEFDPEHLGAGLLECECGRKIIRRINYSGGTTHEVPQYKCGCAGRAKRKDDPHRHLILLEREVDGFLRDLFDDHRLTLISKLQDTGERHQTQAELGIVRQRQKQIGSAYGMARANAEAQIWADLEARYPNKRREQLHPLFEMTYRLEYCSEDDEFASGREEDSDDTRRNLQQLAQEMARLGAAERHLQSRLNSVLSSDQVTALRERLVAWKSFSVTEQNYLIRNVIHVIRHEREGDGREKLVIYLISGEKQGLYPIYLKTSGTKAIRRRMPTCADWVAMHTDL